MFDARDDVTICDAHDYATRWDARDDMTRCDDHDDVKMLVMIQ